MILDGLAVYLVLRFGRWNEFSVLLHHQISSLLLNACGCTVLRCNPSRPEQEVELCYDFLCLACWFWLAVDKATQ